MCMALALGVSAIPDDRWRLRATVFVVAVALAGVLQVAIAPGELPPPPADGQPWVVGGDLALTTSPPVA